MNRTYITPKTIVIGIHGQTLLTQTSMTVGSQSVSNTNDIGFVKDKSSPSNHSVWDDDWSE